jgi:aminoglycoside phosphotransferase (APT) family kinase protein
MKTISKPEALRDPIDVMRLTHWMESEDLPTGPIERLTPLAGGSQNIILRFTKGGRDFVLRRPPLHPREGNNETMRREARVLGALAGSDVPHPALIATCGDEEVLGIAFYLMEPVDGFTATAALLPEPHASDPAMRRAMGFALVDGAAALAGVDYRAAGLDGFGKPEGYLARQVSRWRSQLASYETHDGWPGPQSLSGVLEIALWLDQHRPAQSAAAILHGDYSIGNVLYRRDGPSLAAIVDWELATIGDPLIDLGWILATWRAEGDVDIGVLKVEPFDGFPSPDELVERYAVRSGRDVSQIDWYVVLACYKLAIILEGSYARACAGLAPVSTGARLHGAAVRLLERAQRRIERA